MLGRGAVAVAADAEAEKARKRDREKGKKGGAGSWGLPMDSESVGMSCVRRGGESGDLNPCPRSSRANASTAEFGIAREYGAYYFSGMNTISLKLPDRLLERLEAESRARGTTKSSLVRECLERSLEARPAGQKASCYDLAHDLAGSLKGLPRDLATNPKHMEGFGQ